MKNLSTILKKTIPGIAALMCLQPAIYSQDDNAGGGGGGFSITISMPTDIAQQANSKVHLIRLGYDFDLVIKFTYNTANLLSESAGLLDDIFQNVSIDSSTLSSAHIFNRERLVSNKFSTSMIKLGATHSGNEDLADLIVDAIDSGSLDSSYVGKLSDVINQSNNYNLLGLNANEDGVGDLYDLTTDDVVAFAGNNIDIAKSGDLTGESAVDLSEQDAEIFAVAAGNDLEIHNDVTFSKRSSEWDNEVLAIGAADDITAKGESSDDLLEIKSEGNYLGIGAGGDVVLENALIESKHGVGIASLSDVSITSSQINITQNGGFAIFAQNLIDLDDVTFSADSQGVNPTIYMESITIDLKDVAFPQGSIVDLVSRDGPNGIYPNFGEANRAIGGVNFISNVNYGSEVIADTTAFDAVKDYIKISKF